jgi:hypothetical protein
MKFSRKLSVVCALASVVVFAGCSQDAEQKATATQESGSTVVGDPSDLRRLTADQYRNIIADVFGSDIDIGGRFEPGLREGGLIEVGASNVSITTTGYEQYDKMAQTIASQVLGEKRRDMFLSCAPKVATQPDDACAREFLEATGRLLYRRPLSDRELTSQVEAAAAASKEVGNFYQGLALSLASMLTSPEFLFRHEILEADPKRLGIKRLNAYAKAARLSFLLWNSTPDVALLSAAQKGELHTPSGLAKQVDRMIASPRVESGVRAFFADMLNFDAFETLAKDTTLYSKYNFNVAIDAQEQTLRTVVDLLIKQQGDYRDLFTTRQTFLTPRLAAVYRIAQPAAIGLPNGWQRYEYPESADAAGILTHISFAALHSHPGRTSPTLRGKALRELLLCQKVPDPPGNVDFNIVQDTANPNFKTVRQRLDAHATEAMCKGCHKITDPLGLALEKFDTIGGHRLSENGAAIDTTGELDGVRFTNVAELGKTLHGNARIASCLVERLYAYGVGRKLNRSETQWLNTSLIKDFQRDKFRFPLLLRRIATTETFYLVGSPIVGKEKSATARATP